MGREKHRFAREALRTPPTRCTLRGANAKEFLLGPPPVSLFLSLGFGFRLSCSPSSLAPSHLVVEIHHGISKPFKASLRNPRPRIPVDNGFPGGATVPTEPARLPVSPPAAPDEETRGISADKRNMMSAGGCKGLF